MYGYNGGLLESQFAAEIEKVMPRRYDQLIWHFTDAAGALGILQTRTFWASNVATLNDPDELNHGLCLIENYGSALRSSENYNLVDQWLRDARAKFDNHERFDSFVLCGSKLGDSYEQFDTYGHYAIGINGAVLLEKVANPTTPIGQYRATGAFEVGWRPVLYQQADKDEHIGRLFTVLLSLANRHPKGRGENDPGTYEAAIECIIRSAAYMKAEKWASESEVRLYGRALTSNGRVEFRSGRDDMIVPYLQIRLAAGPQLAAGSFPVMQVAMGPGIPQLDMAKQTLRLMLDRYEFEHVPIVDRSRLLPNLF